MDIEPLIKKIEVLEDFEEAQDALIFLKNNFPSIASKLAVTILKGAQGDDFFQAFAFETLYAADRQAAVQYIQQNVATANDQVYKAMLESVTEDSGIARENPEILQAVTFLHQRAQQLSEEEAVQLGDTLTWFQETYRTYFSRT